MPLTRTLRLSLVAALALACSSDGTSPQFGSFVFSRASDSCGPTDGPAVTIDFAPNPIESLVPASPYVRAYVAVPLDQLAGRAWSLAGASADGGAWFHPDESSYEIADAGYMIVTSVASDYSVTGTIDIQFPKAGHIRTPFHAAWTNIAIICG